MTTNHRLSRQSQPLIPFTKQAFNAMRQKRAKFYQLKTEVMGRLKDAREQGDLSENGAYKYAKFELGNIRRELRKLNYLIENGEVRESVASHTMAMFGHTITVDDGNKLMTFMLVSKHESNPSEQKISTDSPLGSAVNGKRVGEEVKVTTPRGTKKYRIITIK